VKDFLQLKRLMILLGFVVLDGGFKGGLVRG
jgi:hypothetical protein